MPRFNLITRVKEGLASWWSYWKESLSAGQEKHDFMLYSLVTLVIIVATVLTLSGIPLPDLDLSEPVPHRVLVVFELSLITWILLYLPYKRHTSEAKEQEEKNAALLKKSFYILSARWGIWGNFPPVNEGFPPVIDIVRNSIKDGKLKIECEVHVLGDPQERVHKFLIIEYLYAGEKHEGRYKEGEEVNLP